MRIPSLPSGWWLAYIYPMPSGLWAIDARSMTARVAAEAEELEDAIEMAIAKINAEDWEYDEPRQVRNLPATPESLSLLSSIGLINEKPLARRKL